ncbi:MAG: hypothetical protein ABGX83_03325 [Nitrospira sp.]|nr:hypothetical protein [Candidatus Manganitrophaceae bacterium]HIL34310.1 hypothetical protein [Candidatus Manganitrophaceae bacterium]
MNKQATQNEATNGTVIKAAEANIRDTVSIALGHTPRERAVIIYDTKSDLSKLLTEAYQVVLPDAVAFDFNQSDPEVILRQFSLLSPDDLVILVQSTSFRLSQFRIRLELFQRKLKVIEHPHLGRFPEEEVAVYVDALAYDPTYYRTVGPLLRDRIARAERVRIICEDTELIYDTTFLDPRLNIGDYEDMKNIGGQYPIGEVFTEPKEINRLNGTVRLFAFGDTDFRVNVPKEPFTARIEGGLLVSCPDAPLGFQGVLDIIREKEEVVWVRELGFGLNRAFSRDRRVSDIGTYERMCGIHLSLGAKHLQYKKPGFPKKGGFHVDVFVDAQAVEIDGVTIFQDGAYR